MHQILFYRLREYFVLAIIFMALNLKAETADPAALVSPWTGLQNTIDSLGAIAVLPDGQILGGGASSGGQMKLFSKDGVEDLNFVSPVNGQIYQISVGPFGKIYLTGGFNSDPNLPNLSFVRLNANLTLDTDFDPPVSGGSGVYTLNDGSVLLVGNSLHKITREGNLDSDFKSPFNSLIRDIAIQDDGKIIAVGAFTQPTQAIARLHPDGTVDTSFISDPLAANARQIILAPDGSFYVRTRLSNTLVQIVRKFLPSGEADTSFQNPIVSDFINPRIRHIALERDGQILVVGDFGNIGGVERNRLARLNPNGEIDLAFDPGTSFNREANLLAIGPLGRIIVNGEFTTYNGSNAPYIAALGGDCLTVGIASQPAELTVDVGGDVTLEVGAVAAGSAALSYQWQKDGQPISGEVSPSLIISPVTSSDRGVYSVIVTNTESMESVVSRAVPLHILAEPEVIDLSSDIAIDEYEALSLEVAARGASPLFYQWKKNDVDIPGATSSTFQIEKAMGTDSGSYTVAVSNFVDETVSTAITVTVSEWTGPSALATNFTELDFDAPISAILPLPDGRTLIGGPFSRVGDVEIGYLVLINADQPTVDPNFNLNLGSAVNDIVFDSKNRIVIALRSAGEAGSALIRLNSNLSIDSNFSVPSLSSGISTLLAVRDGGFFVGGFFDSANGDPSFARLCKIKEDGTLDTVFRPQLNGSVTDLLIDGIDGLIVAGNFTSPRRYLARFSQRFGEYDESFVPQTFNGRPISALERAEDEDFWAGGFGTIGRFNPDGSQDVSFSSFVDLRPVLDFLPVGAGKVLVGGDFPKISGVVSNKAGQLNQDGSYDSTFRIGEGFSSGQGTSGSSGSGSSGNFNLPASVEVFAKDRLGHIWAGGEFNTYRRKPQKNLTLLRGYPVDFSIFRHPQDQVASEGDFVSFEVHAATTNGEPSSYQWFKDGSPLVEQTSAILNLNDVSSTDEGDYSVAVTHDNTMETLNSDVATLDVLAELKILQLSKKKDLFLGDELLLRVAAEGSGNLIYQWQLNGENLEGENAPFYQINSAVPDNSGIYTVSITNGIETISSDEVSVSVVIPPGGFWLGGQPSIFSREVLDSLVLPNGKILIAGRFSRPSHPDVSITQPNLALLTNNGLPDPSFQLPVNGWVLKLALDQSNRVLLYGHFSTIDGIARNRLARLNPDLTLDLSFESELSLTSSDDCYSILSDSAGRIYLGGVFRTPPAPYTNLTGFIRLLEDGSIDAEPSSPIFAGFVNSMIETSDGKIVCGGVFSSPTAYLARFSSDGVRDTTFNDPFTRQVTHLAQLSDGRIFATDRSGETYLLSPDGEVEREIPFTSSVNSVAVDQQDRILAGVGYFGADGFTTFSITRLLPDGTVDRTFKGSLSFRKIIDSISILNDDRIVLTGDFVESDFQGLVILNGGPVDPYLTWAVDQGLAGQLLDPTQDDDGDGLSNLIEFAYGLPPSQADNGMNINQVSAQQSGADILTSFPTSTVEPGEDYFTFSVLMPNTRAGARVVVRASEDLSFSDEVELIELGRALREPGLDEVQFILRRPISELANGVFYRVQVEKTLR